MGATAKIFSLFSNILCLVFNENRSSTSVLYALAQIAQVWTPFDLSVHTQRGRYASESFKRLRDAEEWAQDMLDVGRPPRRSKAAVVEALKVPLGTVRLVDLDRERLFDFGKRRAKDGAGPATLAIDFSFIRILLTHAAAASK